MLVEDYLVAVVSLPAGVFNPYSGVKTSILILDKALAKRTDRIAFFKVENDGFDLGAQRRPIDKNDLPQVAEELSEYLARLRAGEAVDGSQSTSINRVAEDGIQYSSDEPITRGLVIEKLKVAEGGEYNLSGERYRELEVITSNYEMVTLGQVCEIRKGTAITRKQVVEGPIPVIAGGQTPSTFHNKANRTGETITVSASGAYAGFVSYFDKPIFASDCSTIKPKSEFLLSKFVFHILKARQSEIYALQVGMGQPHVYPKDLIAFQIPLPPLEVQKEIVCEIEGYQRVIDGARAVVDNYHPQIVVDPDWPIVRLGDACESIMDGTHYSPKNTDRGTRLYLTSKNVRENHLDLSNIRFVSEADHQSIYTRCPVRKGDVLYIKDGANTGLAAINTLEEEFSLLSSVAVLRGKSSYLDNRYLCFFLNTKEGRTRLLSMMSGVAIRRLTLTKINQAEIPLPTINDQKEIVAEIEAEQTLVATNRELIERFEKKIQEAIGRVWGKDKTERS